MKIRNQPTYTQIIVILILSAALMFELVGGFEFWFRFREYVTRPIEYTYISVVNGFRNGIESIFGASSLREENIKLRTQLLELQQEISFVKEGKLLCSLAEEQTKKQSESGIKRAVTAVVLDRNAGLSAGIVLIDKGSNDGITKDDIVIANGAFLGQVLESHAFSSLVKTIYSQGYTLKGQIPSKKVTTVLSTNNQAFTASEILISEDVAENDIVYAKPDETKPAFPVGKVLTVAGSTADATKVALLLPLVEIKDLSVVTVVKE